MATVLRLSTAPSTVGELAPGRADFGELAAFAWKNALSCIFPVLIFACLAVSKRFSIPFVPRYDALFLACLGIQVWMVRAGLETKDEVKVITLFHLLGLLMEIQKVRVGSWAYPEEAYSKVLGVPLYSGFMYASVASFMCQAWRRFGLSVAGWPSAKVTIAVGAAIYANFFTNHYMQDLRIPILGAIAVAFFRTKVSFTPAIATRSMPMLAGFGCIGGFLWVAENIATFLGAWKYPYQMQEWQPVHVAKLGSWFLLAIVSMIIVVGLKRLRSARLLAR